MTKDRQFIDVLARGLNVLECLSKANKPLGNGELARMTGLPPSSVSRLTYTLTQLGYIRRHASQRTYELTPKNLALGYPVLSSMSFLDRARPYLRDISEQTGETAALAILDGLHISFVEVVVGANLVAVRLSTGGRLRINVSAAGAAIVSALPERKRWSLLTRLSNQLKKHGEDIRPFNQVLRQCAKHGYALARNLWQEGIGGLAVPVIWQDQLMALTMPVSTGSVSEQRMRNELAPVLVKAAQALGPVSITGGPRRT